MTSLAGDHVDQRHLYETLPVVRERLDELATEPRDAAVIRYVAANTGQSQERTIALLQRLGVLTPKISGAEAGRRLGVSPQRIYQLTDQIRHRIQQAQPPGGVGEWLHQDPDAIGSILE